MKYVRFDLVVSTVIAILLLPAISTIASVPVEKLSPGVAFLRENNTPKARAGTGFFVNHSGTLYLVTAAHVSAILSDSSLATIATSNDRPFTFPLRDLISKNEPLQWNIHSVADIAVLRLSPCKQFFDDHLSGHFFPSSWIERNKESPLRALTLTVVGFPLQLGVSEYFSPLSRETKTASGLLEMPRFDNKIVSSFFISQDPSVGGFSGAPLFDTRLPYSTANTGIQVEMGLTPRIVGLVHGTLVDDTGGKLGAIVPAFLILEAIEKGNGPPKQ